MGIPSVLKRIRMYLFYVFLLCTISILYNATTVVDLLWHQVRTQGVPTTNRRIILIKLGSPTVVLNDVQTSHNPVMVNILPLPNITEEQKQTLDKLTDNDLAYKNTKTQYFNLNELESRNNQSMNETLPMYPDWDAIGKHVKKTWYENYRQAEGRFDKGFSATVSLKERKQMTAILEVFMKACEWANVTYFLSGGTLLGSIRHHGFIPWDDDIDIMVKSSHWKKLYYVLSRIPEFTIYPRKDDMWKFYLTAVPRTFNFPYKWPFLDVFFYAENATHLWGTTRSSKYVMSRKSEVFPLRMRPFEHTRAPVPCNARIQLFSHFIRGNCQSNNWNHKTESGMSIRGILCKKLQHVFPFVFEMHDRNGTVTEILKVGNRTVQTFISPPHCTGV